MNQEDVKAFVSFVELILRKQFDSLKYVGIGDIARTVERLKKALPANFELDIGAESSIILTVARNFGLVK